MSIISESGGKKAWREQQAVLRAQGLKRCTRCGETQPFSEYHAQKEQPDGRRCYCKTCCIPINLRTRTLRGDKQKEYFKEYYQQNREVILNRSKAQYWQDPAKSKKRALEWARKNSEKVRQSRNRWAKQNPEMIREYCRQRRSLKQGVKSVPFTLEQLRQKCQFWGDRCWVCRGPQEAIDHMKPMNKGGAHILCNLRPICIACNTRKLDRWPYSP